MVPFNVNVLIPLIIVSENEHDLASGFLRFFEIDRVAEEAERLASLGMKRCKLYVKTHADLKDLSASAGLEKDALMVRAIQAILDAVPDMDIGTEVCACAYSSAGECVITAPDGVADAATHRLVREMAVLHADAGATTVVAGLTHDGSIAAIREGLDASGHKNVSVMGSVQLRTSFYGPYRQMMGTEPEAGETFRSHILPVDVDGVVEKARQHVAEGADSLSIQPALLGSPLISAIKKHVQVPVVTYSVSTELHLVRGNAPDLWLAPGKEGILVEYYNMLLQSGADGVQSYVAGDLAAWMEQQLVTHP